MPADDLPSLPGTYALLLQAGRLVDVWCGPRLGYLLVRPGWYVYLGSARGRGGLRGRIQHHLRPAANPRWHMDYLRQEASAQEVWYSTAAHSHECDWAAVCSRLPDAQPGWLGFGASDCRCKTHLYYFEGRPQADLFSETLREVLVVHKIAAAPNAPKK